ncbi:uncharacterized protein LOC122033538 [Zingiber officinale]|uniref:uncharacterized protein LOC122033538 n=1 Tax=Zingiber officinale TaxID=94328 RepID=UPI001C4AE1BB|nr:uncharacterized protein LOC122033538 [Zingiber officinale]
MGRANLSGQLLPFDPEIDKTFLRRRNLQKAFQAAKESSGMADKLLKDYPTPYERGVQSSITRPPIDADNFKIKPAVIHMVQLNQFGGGPHEDPNHHLELFYEICGTMKVNEVSPELVRLLLFGFSLKDRVKQWLNSLPADSISSWEQCEQKFLDKFYPPSKTAHMRNLIASFKQIDSESLFEAWDWFKSMQRQCPHHGGALMNKSLDEAKEIIENVALNHHQWASERSSGAFSGNQMKALGKFEVDAFTLMSTKLDAKFEAMGSNTANAIVCVCDICGSADHAQDTCPLGAMQVQINQLEQCDAITGYNQRQNNPYSNTYNPGWRNHPNFSYRNNQDQGPAHQTYQPGQQTHQQQQPTQLSRIEKMLEEALSEQKEMRSEIKQLT